MKNKLRFLTLTFLLHATSSWAVPMLSANGSLLTGVDVGGTLYDVMFGNGVVGEVYAGVTFDAAREAEARAVSTSVIQALNSVRASTYDIFGCSTFSCFIFIPTSYDGVNYTASAMPFGDESGRPKWKSTTGPTDLPLYYPTQVNSALTLVTYTETGAPIPTSPTFLLFGLGLAALGLISPSPRETDTDR